MATTRDMDGKLKGAVGKRRRGSSSSGDRPAQQLKSSQAFKPVLPGDGKFHLPLERHRISLLIPTLIGVSQVSYHVLASKSNYQVMVEGKHAQLGLSYPDHLLTNIDSKRTNHSASERERRNRMNNALQEMAKLLPQGNCAGVAENNSSTIVSIVERAIEYIKALQKELVEMRTRLEEKPVAEQGGEALARQYLFRQKSSSSLSR